MKIPYTWFSCGGKNYGKQGILCSTASAMMGLSHPEILGEIDAGRLEKMPEKKKKYRDGERSTAMQINRESLKKWLMLYDVKRIPLQEISDYTILSINDLVRLSGLSHSKIESFLQQGIVPKSDKAIRGGKHVWYAGVIKKSRFASFCYNGEQNDESNKRQDNLPLVAQTSEEPEPLNSSTDEERKYLDLQTMPVESLYQMVQKNYGFFTITGIDPVEGGFMLDVVGDQLDGQIRKVVAERQEEIVPYLLRKANVLVRSEFIKTVLLSNPSIIYRTIFG